MKTTHIIASALFAFSLISCGLPTTPSGSGQDSTAVLAEDSVTAAATKPAQPESAWEYTEETDEMTDKVNRRAYVISENSANFDFPYDGGSRLALNIRDHSTLGKDIWIYIDKGQFNTGIYGQKVTLRFDDEKPITVNGNSSSDGSADVLFLSSYKKLLPKLLKAKTLKVQVEFFQEGNRTFTFDVAGLKWQE